MTALHQPQIRVGALSYGHEALIDLILLDPSQTYKQLAEKSGYSAAWIGKLVNSDSFQARLAERKGNLTDPMIKRALDSRVQRMSAQAAASMQRQLELGSSADDALKALGVMEKVVSLNGKLRA